jgi:hypothetical protein
MADDANRSVAAPAIGGNPSSAESMPLARPVPGVVVLSGIPKTLQSLNAECAQK